MSILYARLGPSNALGNQIDGGVGHMALGNPQLKKRRPNRYLGNAQLTVRFLATLVALDFTLVSKWVGHSFKLA